jgi:hypothetical protein
MLEEQCRPVPAGGFHVHVVHCNTGGSIFRKLGDTVGGGGLAADRLRWGARGLDTFCYRRNLRDGGLLLGAEEGIRVGLGLGIQNNYTLFMGWRNRDYHFLALAGVA